MRRRRFRSRAVATAALFAVGVRAKSSSAQPAPTVASSPEAPQSPDTRSTTYLMRPAPIHRRRQS